MYANTSPSTMCRIHVQVVPLAVLLLTLLSLPGPLLAQKTDGGSQIEALVESSDDAVSLPLTTAQEQASSWPLSSSRLRKLLHRQKEVHSLVL